MTGGQTDESVILKIRDDEVKRRKMLLWGDLDCAGVYGS